MKKISLTFLSMFLGIVSMLAIPRTEYPRPQFERTDWINLNGEWTCSFDFSGTGLEREFYKSKGFDVIEVRESNINCIEDFLDDQIRKIKKKYI